MKRIPNKQSSVFNFEQTYTDSNGAKQHVFVALEINYCEKSYRILSDKKTESFVFIANSLQKIKKAWPNTVACDVDFQGSANRQKAVLLAITEALSFAQEEIVMNNISNLRKNSGFRVSLKPGTDYYYEVGKVFLEANDKKPKKEQFKDGERIYLVWEFPTRGGKILTYTYNAKEATIIPSHAQEATIPPRYYSNSISDIIHLLAQNDSEYAKIKIDFVLVSDDDWDQYRQRLLEKASSEAAIATQPKPKKTRNRINKNTQGKPSK